MFLLILGIIALITSRFIRPIPPRNYNLGRIAQIVGVLFVLIGFSTACFVQINSGQVGVKTLFGKVQPEILTSGLNFINPLVEVVPFDVKTQNYTMSGIHDEGDKSGDDAIRVLTSDGLEISLDLTVLFRVEAAKAPIILQEIGREYVTTIVRPLTRTKIRDNAVYYDAISLYSQKREEFQNKIFTSIQKDFEARGLVLEQLLIRNIDLPKSVKQTIESKINAEQEAQKMKFVLEKETQEAERKRLEAQGIADYQRIINTSLTTQQLQYEMIKAQKEIATSPNTKVIIVPANSNTPFIIGN